MDTLEVFFILAPPYPHTALGTLPAEAEPQTAALSLASLSVGEDSVPGPVISLPKDGSLKHMC